MRNHHRGPRGYTRIASDGAPLTIQSTGLGGPSTAIVVEELIGLGARRLVRVGTRRAPLHLPLGSLVVAERVRAITGRLRALGAGAASEPDPELLAGLTGGAWGEVVSMDLDHDPRPERWEGAVAVDLAHGGPVRRGRAAWRASGVCAVVSESPAGRIEAKPWSGPR